MKPEDLTQGAVIYGLKKGFVGKVARLYEAGEFVSPANKKPVQAPVVTLETGDSLIADEESIKDWEVLDAKGAQFFKDCNQATTEITKAICGAARGLGISPALCFLILGRAFMLQGGALLKPQTSEEEGKGWDG
jgi:hypothetical protein